MLKRKEPVPLIFVVEPANFERFKKQAYYTKEGKQSTRSISWISQYVWCLVVVDVIADLREKKENVLKAAISWEYDDSDNIPFVPHAEVCCDPEMLSVEGLEEDMEEVLQ